MLKSKPLIKALNVAPSFKPNVTGVNKLMYMRYSDTSERVETKKKESFDSKKKPIRLSGFELQLLELSQRKESSYSKITPLPMMISNQTSETRLETLYKKNRARKNLNPGDLRDLNQHEEDELEDILLSNIMTLHSCNDVNELHLAISDIFNELETIPPSRLITESIYQFKRFKDPFGCYAIIEQIKRKGLLSLIESFDTEVYNSWIDTIWSCTKDPLRIIQILNEMNEHCVAPDQKTFKLLIEVKICSDVVDNPNLLKQLNKTIELLGEPEMTN